MTNENQVPPRFNIDRSSDEILAGAQHLIGSRYVESVHAYILELTGLQKVKVVRGGADTKDYVGDRVRVYVNATGLIERLNVC